MKFLKTFSSIKSKWIKQINDRKISTNFIEKNSLKVFLLSTNIEEYCNKKTNKKRQLYSLIACLFSGFIAFRFLIAALITDPELIALIGDPLYLAGDKVLLNLTFFFVSIITFISRVCCFICKYFLIYSLLYQNFVMKVSEIILCIVCNINTPFKMIYIIVSQQEICVKFR
jgi:hypothetical protein